MYEMKQDPFYKVLADYPDCVVRYCVIKGDGPYCGKASHRDVLAFAIQGFIALDGQHEATQSFDIGSAVAKKAEPNAFFLLPKKPQIMTARETGVDNLPYWQAFLEPPHGNDYEGSDFVRINSALFPKGTDRLEIFRWTTDWSDYFAEGREWWGTLCATVYDKALDRFSVIAAAATD